MEFYIDIKLMSDTEVRENVLLNKVYTNLHKALVTLKSIDIGVSFPEYHVKLGDVIRIHGDRDKLIALQTMHWLGDLAGYCNVGDISAVPEQTQFRTVSRKQSNMTESKLRRLLKRGTILPENVSEYKTKMVTQWLDSPYLELESASNGHKYRRYIQFGELLDASVKDAFDQFGLSKVATIPWF